MASVFFESLNREFVARKEKENLKSKPPILKPHRDAARAVGDVVRANKQVNSWGLVEGLRADKEMVTALIRIAVTGTTAFRQEEDGVWPELKWGEKCECPVASGSATPSGDGAAKMDCDAAPAEGNGMQMDSDGSAGPMPSSA